MAGSGNTDIQMHCKEMVFNPYRWYMLKQVSSYKVGLSDMFDMLIFYSDKC
jgi:hypothetical protein